jgi:putative phosphoesterase
MINRHSDRKHQKIGLISDTHGLLRPEAVDALQGSDLIIHAGDVGDLHILDELKSIAPVIAVRGNMDNEGCAYTLKRTEITEICDNSLYVLHDISKLDLDPSSAHIRAVIYGHSHRPSIEEHEGVLYINPGSAGPRRFKLPVTVALIDIQGKKLNPEIIRLKV